MANYYKQNLRYHLLLMLVTPILGLIYGIRTGSLKIMRWTIFVFTVIYGSLLTFQLFGGEKGADKGADGARHLNNVYEHYTNLDFAIWWKELIAIMSFKPFPTTNDDPFIHIISYLAGTVFGYPPLFFTLVAIVYGYFFSGTLVKIFNYINWKSGYNKFYFLFFLVLLVLWKNPTDMQTVRSWTGMWILIYALLSYYETKKIKYLILAFIPPLIHVGFYAISIPAWIVLFSNFRNPKLYFIVFVISIFISNITEKTDVLNSISKTELGASKTKAYYIGEDRQDDFNERKVEKASGSNFYRAYEELRLHYYVLTGFIFFIFFVLRERGFSKLEDTLFSYGLAFASFANLFISIFALYSRTWQVAGVFILALIVVFLSKQNFKNTQLSSLKIKFPLVVFTLALLPYVLFKISGFINLSSAFILLLPIFSWINPDLGISIKQSLFFFL